MDFRDRAIETADPRQALVVLRLLTTRGIGPRTVAQILEKTAREEGGLEELLSYSPAALESRYQIPPEAAERFVTDKALAERMWKELSDRSIAILLRGATGYPRHLTAALGKDAPPVLFASGDLSILEKPAVGFAGSRKASEKGLAVAAECAGLLAAKGVNVISGYAHGVDLAAHHSALKAGGVTTIVLAEGIIGFRLKANIKELTNARNLLVISEFSPRLPWSARHAMARNHTICGLSHAIIVIESGMTGGTFEAGRVALELRRPLFVVDYAHPADSAEGNVYFLKQGAKPLRRNRAGQANLEELLRAVEAQHTKGNEPVPPSQPLFDTAPRWKPSD